VDVPELQQERTAQTQGAPDDTEAAAEPPQKEGVWESPDPEGPLQSPPQSRAKGQNRTASRSARDARPSEAGAPIGDGDNGGTEASGACGGTASQETGPMDAHAAPRRPQGQGGPPPPASPHTARKPHDPRN
jgi:hypothetical protein